MTVFLVNGMGIGTAWNILPCHRTVDCGGDVGFIPALKREAFSSILRNFETPDVGAAKVASSIVARSLTGSTTVWPSSQRVR